MTDWTCSEAGRDCLNLTGSIWETLDALSDRFCEKAHIVHKKRIATKRLVNLIHRNRIKDMKSGPLSPADFQDLLKWGAINAPPQLFKSVSLRTQKKRMRNASKLSHNCQWKLKIVAIPSACPNVRDKTENGIVSQDVEKSNCMPSTHPHPTLSLCFARAREITCFFPLPF